MVVMPKQNVPALRLEGFDGEWEQSRLSDHLTLSEDTNANLEFGREDVYAVSLDEGLVNQIKFHGRSFAGKNLDNYDVIHTGEVVYTKSPLKFTPYGIFKSHFGATGIVSPLYAVYRTKPHTDARFVQDYFALPERLNTYLSPLVNKGAKNTMNISDWDALDGAVTFPPTLEEQQAIGAIFTNLDAAINQHTIKHKALQQAKTALMQRMFPQEGQTVPELRLEGFSGEWGSAPLQQLASLFTDGDWIESKDQSTEGIRLLQTGNVGIGTFVQKSATQKWVSEETFKRLRCQEVLPGDILISRLPDPAGRACIVPMMPYRMITAVDCTIVRLSEENDADYLVAYLGNPSYFEHIDTLLAGGTRQRVSRSQLAVVEIPVPPTLEEQQAIGAVFTQLDTLITAEAQYIKSLKQAKMALLQRMFI